MLTGDEPTTPQSSADVMTRDVGFDLGSDADGESIPPDSVSATEEGIGGSLHSYSGPQVEHWTSPKPACEELHVTPC